MSPMHSSPRSMNDSVRSEGLAHFIPKTPTILSKDNTRTCSTEMGIAQLLKEHGAKAKEEINAPTGKYKRDSSKSLKGEDGRAKPATRSRNAIRMDFPGPLVWNRTLQRSFLLSDHSAGQGFTSRTNGASVSAKPETPPNSPTHDFEEKFTFLDDGYLSPECNEDTQSGDQGQTRGFPCGPATNSYPEDEFLDTDDMSSATAMRQSSEANSQNLDWSQLHGSSGALYEPFSNNESKSSSERR